MGCIPCSKDLDVIYHKNSINSSSKIQIKKNEIKNIMNNKIDNQNEQNKNGVKINEIIAINNDTNEIKRESARHSFPNLFNVDIDIKKKISIKNEKLKMIEENEKNEQSQEENKPNKVRNSNNTLDNHNGSDREKTDDTRKKTISFISPIEIDNKLKKIEEKDSEKKSVVSNSKNEEKFYFFDNEFLKTIEKSNNSHNNREKIKLIHFDEKNKKFKETLYNKKYFIEKYEPIEAYYKTKKFKFLFPRNKLKNSKKDGDNILEELKTSLCLKEIKKLFNIDLNSKSQKFFLNRINNTKYIFNLSFEEIEDINNKANNNIAYQKNSNNKDNNIEQYSNKNNIEEPIKNNNFRDNKMNEEQKIIESNDKNIKKKVFSENKTEKNFLNVHKEEYKIIINDNDKNIDSNIFEEDTKVPTNINNFNVNKEKNKISSKISNLENKNNIINEVSNNNEIDKINKENININIQKNNNKENNANELNNINNNINNLNIINKNLEFFPLVGLKNVGSTCFMNATLQCLIHIPDLSFYFLNEYPNDKISLNSKNFSAETKGHLSEAYYDIIRGIEDLNKQPKFNNNVYNPKNFKETLGRYNLQFSRYEANDSKDLILYLLQTFHEELNYFGDIKAPNNINPPDPILRSDTYNFFRVKYNSTNFSKISQLFYGTYENSITCLECKNIFYSYQKFEYISFYTYNYKNKNFDIMQGFENIECKQSLTGDNKYNCKKCKKLVEAEIVCKIIDLPTYLILNIDYGKNKINKVRNLIFNHEIDLQKYISFYFGQKTKYKLVSICTHIGSSGPTGHYIAYCLCKRNNQWYKFSDSSYYKCEKYELNNNSPYLLLYEMIF